METLAGSRTQKREGNTGPVDPRATNVSFGKDKTLYRSEVAYTHRSMRRLKSSMRRLKSLMRRCQNESFCLQI